MSRKNKPGMSSSVGISSAEMSSVRKKERARAKELLAERREELRKMVYAALFLALAFLLPFLTANNQQIATALSPMHIPAFLCGFVCGPGWGAAVGFWAIAGAVGNEVVLGSDAHRPEDVCDVSSERTALAIVKKYSLRLLESLPLREL